MQDRYAGDIGDFGKFALLGELSKKGLTIGVNWYKTTPLKPEKNNDGGYIDIPQNLKECSPILAERLAEIAKSDSRSIQALEEAQLITNTVYYSEPV